MSAPVFGHPPGVAVGDLFPDRRALASAGVHRPMQAGICGRAADGCESIVLSGGYADDQDFGDVLLYTGAGGRDRESGRQVGDQPLNGWNRSLVTSLRLGLPARVARRVYDAAGAPTGYRYDGLYRVASYWSERGLDGFRVWRFRLEALPGETTVFYSEVAGPHHAAEPTPDAPAPRSLVTVSRIVRDSAVTRRVKELHAFRCQACGARLDTPTGPYAEAAHIVPLGAPHAGPDVLENVLCLCPNHHATFDLYAWTVGELGELIGLDGLLRRAPGHAPGPEYLRAHRTQYDAVRDSQT